jgi:hypothetical protein
VAVETEEGAVGGVTAGEAGDAPPKIFDINVLKRPIIDCAWL